MTEHVEVSKMSLGLGTCYSSPWCNQNQRTPSQWVDFHLKSIVFNSRILGHPLYPRFIPIISIIYISHYIDPYKSIICCCFQNKKAMTFVSPSRPRNHNAEISCRIQCFGEINVRRSCGHNRSLRPKKSAIWHGDSWWPRWPPCVNLMSTLALARLKVFWYVLVFAPSPSPCEVSF